MYRSQIVDNLFSMGIHKWNDKLGSKIGYFELRMEVLLNKKILRKSEIHFRSLDFKPSWGKKYDFEVSNTKKWFKIYWCTQIYIKVNTTF